MNNYKLSEFSGDEVELEVSTSFRDNLVEITFDYNRYLSSWNLLPEFSKDKSYKNWKMWEYDVFEIFLQFRKNENDIKAPYVEMQATPLSQKLNLLIIKPRSICQILLYDQFEIKLSDNEKKITFKIDLNELEIKKTPFLYGGFFSCLGIEPKRKYFSSIELKGKLDFHQPMNFVRIK